MNELEQLKKHYRMLRKRHVNIPDNMDVYMRDIGQALKRAGSNFNKPRLLSLNDHRWVELKSLFTIGRHCENSLVLNCQELEEYHCRISNDSKDWLIEDLSSLSGTFINGHKIDSKVLVSGDLIKVDGHDFIFFRI